MGCVLVQESWVDWPDVTYDRVGNILLSRLMGADVRLVAAPASGSASRRAGSRRWPTSRPPAASRTRSRPARPTIRLGGLGFASWAREVEAQERELGVFFDTIVVCSVTGSTQAGMVAGLRGCGERERRVLGIDGSARPAETREQVARIARATAELIGLDRDLRDDEIELDERYHAGIYGIPDEQTLEAMRARRAARGHDHRPGLRGEVDGGHDRPRGSGEIDRDSTVLYAHLGGQPALNAYAASVPGLSGGGYG